ncbi:MAG: DUF305 domain-containing protein [Gemmatimonadetes bacterium]|nr:DUF305 domain-containing protein [Gemmatimonadota bacterium]
MRVVARPPLVAVAVLAAGCASGGTSPRTADGPSIVQPGAPGAAGRVVSAADLAAASGPTHTDADVHFLHMMVPHHAQALEMAALVPARAAGEAVRQMALRMEISQRDEIAWIERWLRTRGEPMPGEHHSPGMPMPALMPGMLTPAEMDLLRAARGEDFDRLFLESMIRHHEGAITMVEELFATPGAGQESEVYQFASEVEVDQRIEIDRMNGLLQTGGGR